MVSMIATTDARRFCQVIQRSARIPTQLRCHRLNVGVAGDPPVPMSSVA
jgi:hypothetical protein